MCMIIIFHGKDSVHLQTAKKAYTQVALLLAGSFTSPILKLNTCTALVCSVNEEKQAEAKEMQRVNEEITERRRRHAEQQRVPYPFELCYVNVVSTHGIL